MLFAALCAAVAPQVPRRVQSWLELVLCGPLLVLARGGGESPQPSDGTAPALAADLRQRQVDAALAGAAALLPAGLEPVLCRVVERDGRGGGGRPSLLCIDRTQGDLSDCETFVTHGEALVGFLVRTDGEAASPARVALLNHDVAGEVRRVVAQVEVDEGPLRFVVEPAARLDAWRLRCALIEDPYAATRIRGSGRAVRTVEFREDPLGPVPAGLWLGRLCVWGYAGQDLPIGLFVEPELEAEAAAVVVAWRPRRGEPSARLDDPASEVPRRAVRCVRLPAPPPAAERWLLRSPVPGALAPGTALVAGLWLRGTVERGGDGLALGTPFGHSRRRWSLTLLPDDPALAPVDIVARSAAVSAGRGGAERVRLEVLEGSAALPPGTLFTGANGRGCPAGLLIGAVEPRAGQLEVVLPARPEASLAAIGAEAAR